MDTVPEYAAPIWKDGRVLNKGMLPLWSGKAPPPAVGEEVLCYFKDDPAFVVTGYEIEHGWLMVVGYRKSDPTTRRNLGGVEIL